MAVSCRVKENICPSRSRFVHGFRLVVSTVSVKREFDGEKRKASKDLAALARKARQGMTVPWSHSKICHSAAQRGAPHQARTCTHARRRTTQGHRSSKRAPWPRSARAWRAWRLRARPASEPSFYGEQPPPGPGRGVRGCEDGVPPPRAVSSPIVRRGPRAATFPELTDDESLEDIAKSAAKGESLSICVFGASGDLAKKKVLPAIFSLYYDRHLPENVRVFGYARSKMTNEEFKEKIRESLPCRISAAGNCDDVIESFLERMHYVSGLYDDPKDFKALDQAMAAEEAKMGKKAMRIFYLSIPPSIFVPVAQNAARECSSSTGETR